MALRWYVVHTYSGYENKVKTALEEKIKTLGLDDRITDVSYSIRVCSGIS